MSIQAEGLDFYTILQVDPRAHPSVVQAAYRALARLLHPDQTLTDATEPDMALLNRAYGVVRDPAQRKAYDESRSRSEQAAAVRRSVAAGPGRAAPPSARGGTGTQMTFGRYRGWTLEELAKHDPDYLLWLKRHSSGIGYRRQIDEILAVDAAARRRRQPVAGRR